MSGQGGGKKEVRGKNYYVQKRWECKVVSPGANGLFHIYYIHTREYYTTAAGVENVSDHGTIAPRKFFGIPENIQDSVAEEVNVKQILTKVK